MTKIGGVEEIMTWRGVDINELTREELLEALRQCHGMYESECKMHNMTSGILGAMDVASKGWSIPRNNTDGLHKGWSG